MNKICIKCSTIETTKWFSGPICRKCYRAIPKIRNKELEATKRYKHKNREKILNKKKEWRLANKHYDRDRCYNDICFKIKKRLRTRINQAIKNNSKKGSAIKDLGCSIQEFKNYLESMFEPWMTWDNHGAYDSTRDTWHIDHIIPLNMFDMTDRKQFLKACHYTNMRPLLAIKNLQKGSKFDLQQN